MTDIELTKLCAAAMGYAARDDSMDEFIDGIPPNGLCVRDKKAPPIRQVFYYDPLHDDAQAMALVKKLDLSIARGGQATDSPWWRVTSAQWLRRAGSNADLNRAICECVAYMIKAKHDAAR